MSIYDKSRSRVGLFPSADIPSLPNQQQITFTATTERESPLWWRSFFFVSILLIAAVGLVTSAIWWLVKRKHSVKRVKKAKVLPQSETSMNELTVEPTH